MTITRDDSTENAAPSSRSPLAMTPAERMAFLAAPHVGVVVHGLGAGAAPAASPVWYRYEPGGDIVFVTGAHTQKAAQLAVEPAMTFLVQEESHPQKFVAASGTAVVSTGADDDVRRSIAARYIPAEAVEQFVAMTPGTQLVTVSMTPTRWRSSDFGKLAGAGG